MHAFQYFSGEKGKHTGLVTLLLALNSEATLSGDLNAQQFILKICANWLAGKTIYCVVFFLLMNNTFTI